MRQVMLALLLSSSTATRQPAVGGETAPQQAKGQKAPAPKWGVSFGGWVTAVSDDSITMQGVEAELRGVVGCTTGRGMITYHGHPITLTTPTQTVKGVRVDVTRGDYTVTEATGNVTTIRERDQTPRVFKFTPEVTSNKPRPLISSANSYRPTDVKVGDYVGIRFDRVDGEEIATELRIFRRPGGLVPPAPNDPGDCQGVKYHERQNAENDWVDHGVPIPERFLSPREREERRAKIAPMPREVVPKIRHAEP